MTVLFGQIYIILTVIQGVHPNMIKVIDLWKSLLMEIMSWGNSISVKQSL